MKRIWLMVFAATALSSAGCTHKLVDQTTIDWSSCDLIGTRKSKGVEIKQFQCGPAGVAYGVARGALRHEAAFPAAQEHIYDHMRKLGPALAGFTDVVAMSYGDEYDMGGYEALEMTLTSGSGAESKLMAQGYMSLAHDGSNIYISFCASATVTNELCEGVLDDLFHDVETPISDQLPQ